MAGLPNTLNESLSQIKGRALSSVEFVQDYVHLRFDGAFLTAYTWPYLTVGVKTFSWGEGSYKDSLCSQIGIQVRDANIVQGRALSIFFEDGAILTVSLRDSDYRGPEAVQFSSNDGAVWVV
ncbi:MAG TPA: hypothetical protein VN176_18240 [Verrucomicrobiae bacterium]|jgi:hypothetical protein|nr:hypothetical protein [Verrucomicrobiae bacterium]